MLSALASCSPLCIVAVPDLLPIDPQPRTCAACWPHVEHKRDTGPRAPESLRYTNTSRMFLPCACECLSGLFTLPPHESVRPRDLGWHGATHVAM